MASDNKKINVISLIFALLGGLIFLVAIVLYILIFTGAIKFSVIKTAELEPQLYSGDVIVYKDYNDNLYAGDIALYTKNGKTVVQKVENISLNGNQKIYSSTIGDDTFSFTSSQVFGVCERKSRLLTFVVATYSSTAGIIIVSTVCVLIITAGIILAKITRKEDKEN